MEKSIEVTGKTIDDAVASALRQLDKERDDVTVEVLEKPRSGFLGLGGSPAKVRVTWAQPALEVALDFLRGLMERMGIEAGLQAKEAEDGSLQVDFSGANMGVIIGRRGETLDAIQHLTAYVVSKAEQRAVRVTVDAENYRQKRDQTLIRMAQRTAASVIKYRRSITLEPMNAYERHVIHTALQDTRDITTHSTGSEPNRRIIVAYKGEGQTSRPPRRSNPRNR